MRRSERYGGHTPTLPILLVVGGALSLVGGVAVPIRSLQNAPAAIVSGSVPPTSPAVLVGVGLCVAGIASLVLGTLLLSVEPA